MPLPPSSSANLRQQLATYFNLSELQNLSHDLGIKPETIKGSTPEDFARELVEHCGRRGMLDVLVERCKELRPHISWHEDKKAPRSPKDKKDKKVSIPAEKPSKKQPNEQPSNTNSKSLKHKRPAWFHRLPPGVQTAVIAGGSSIIVAIIGLVGILIQNSIDKPSTPTATLTPTNTLIPSSTSTPTVTPTNTPTLTPTPSATTTTTFTPTPTPSPTPTSTPTWTPSPTPTSTPTHTPTPIPYQVLEYFAGSYQSIWWSPDPHVFSYVISSEQAYSGSQSLRIEYHKTDTYQFIAAELPSSQRNIGWAQSIEVWVYGEVSILLTLEDENLSQADVTTMRASNPAGWTLLHFNINDVRNQVDLNHIKTIFFFPEPGNPSANGVIYFDNLAVSGRP